MQLNTDEYRQKLIQYAAPGIAQVDIFTGAEFTCPWTNYQFSQELIQLVFTDLQKSLTSEAYYLEFGCGEGNSFRSIASVIDPVKFARIVMYDICERSLAKAKNLRRQNFKNWEVTNELPKTLFDIINMSLVASLDLNLINQAAKLLNETGYLVIFDYDLKDASPQTIAQVCTTDLERRLITKNWLGFYNRTVQNGRKDYVEGITKNGLELIFEQKLPKKFCLLVGQKPSTQLE